MPSEQEVRDQRHHAIRGILRRGSVRRQEDLVARLRQEGFEATQSSVSRDLRELGAAKIAGRYVVPSPAAGSRAPHPVAEIAHLLRAVHAAGPHLTVLLTETGAAQTVGIALDRAGWTEIAGTIAGDDTVFAATARPRDQSRVLHRLRALMAGKEGPR